MDETHKQAHQGSVAAIIQILNEQLADVGVRTRAVSEEGVLQILCEAATVDQLEQTSLVVRVQNILERIAPRKIRRVKINSRIAREEQLLWLEEISRDPNNLLWCQEILLTKPNLIVRLKRRLQEESSAEGQKQELLKAAARKPNRKIVFWQGLIGGISISLLIVTIVWVILARSSLFQETKSPESSTVSSNISLTPEPEAENDVFANAVNLATEASQKGQQAQSSAQWLALAAKWEQAAELMDTVPAKDPRYQTAQEKVAEYRQNSKIAQQHSQNSRPQKP